MSPDAVAQALSGLDTFVARSKQRLEQQQQHQQLHHQLRIINAPLLAMETVRNGFATKRTRLAQGIEKQMVRPLRFIALPAERDANANVCAY